jgi:hypothetical protein
MRRFSLTTSLLLATILAVGFAPIWGFVVSSLLQFVLPASPRAQSIVVRQDGTPLLSHWDVAGESVFYTDLQGKPVEVDAAEPWLNWINLGLRSAEPPSVLSWRQRVRKFSDQRSRPTLWYVISDGQPHGRAYFVGYDAASKYRVGFIAKDGFRETLPPAEDCFPFSGGMRAVDDRIASLQDKNSYVTYNFDWPAGEDAGNLKKWQLYLLGDDQRIYAIDLRERTVGVAFTTPHIEACDLYAKSSKSPTFLLVRTDRQVLVLDQKKVARTYTIPPELVTKSFRWAEVAPDQALAQWDEYSLSISKRGSEPFVWFNESGHITRREKTTGFLNAWPNTSGSLACPSFVVVVVTVCWIYPYELLLFGATDSWPIALHASLEGFWPSVVFVTILSALLAVACYRRQVRYAATPIERTAWPVFVFLGGLPAWVAYRYGRHWPPLEHCAECGALIPRDREQCARCRREFPLPQRQGFEILTA